jgi:chromosome segregation ATPase
VQIEVEVAELKSTLKRTESETAARDEATRTETDALRAELTKSKRDKESTASRLREQEQAAELLKRKLAQVQQESLAKAQGLENSLREVRLKLTACEARLEAAREKQHELEDTAAAARSVQSRLEQRVAELQQEAELAKRDFVRQIESIAPTYKEQSERYVKRMNLALGKERKRAEAYKAKALEAHSRVKALSETLHREGDDM